MIRRFGRGILIAVLLVGLFSSEEVSAQIRVRACLDLIFKSINDAAQPTREKLNRFGAEVKHDGFKRFFIKDLPKVETISDTKLLGILRATEKSDEHWFWTLDTEILQFVPRQVTKAVYKKSYDVLPVGRWLYRRAERAVLPTAKTLTNAWKFGGAVALYPLSFWGLTNLALTHEEKDKVVKDLDYLIDEDYRFRSVKQKYGDQNARKGREKEALREAIEIKAQYETYFSAMQSLKKAGVNYDNPVATMTLYSDSTLLSKVGPLFSDVQNVLNPDYYRNKPYIDVQHLKKSDAQLVHDLTVLTHQKLMIEATADELFSGSNRVPASIREQFDRDPFYQAVKKQLNAKKITEAQAIEAFDERTHWRTRMKMYQVVGAVPFQLKDDQVTADTLRIADLEREILKKLEQK